MAATLKGRPGLDNLGHPLEDLKPFACMFSEEIRMVLDVLLIQILLFFGPSSPASSVLSFLVVVTHPVLN